MAKKRALTPGVRRHLHDNGLYFLQYLRVENIVARDLDVLAEGLVNLLKDELHTNEQCQQFWKGIKPALAGCPEDDHFHCYENILAYGFVHLLDRYLRVWEIMESLVQQKVLPVPQKNPAVLDIGSGPAPVLYAAANFYRQLSRFAQAEGIERLVTPVPELQPIELSQDMCHFFHVLSEYSKQDGPYGALLSDFSEFDPQGMRKHDDTDNDSLLGGSQEIQTWTNDLHRYQLVFFSNFLTAPNVVVRFSEQISSAFANQRPGGVIVVQGGVGGPYPKIYRMLEDLSERAGHRRIHEIPEVFDDTFRQSYFPRIKAFHNSVWDHLERACETTVLDKTGYPPYWDEAKPISSLKKFAVRVYRKNGW